MPALPVNGKPLALLCRVALGTGRALARDAVAEELWSDLAPPRARAQLRNALWLLRTQLDREVIRATESTLSLACPVESDRADFERLASDGRHADALALYGGDFLAHFAVPRADGFVEWVDFERRNLRNLYLSTGDAEIRRLVHGGHFRSAVTTARQLRDTDPLSLAGWRLVLFALGAAQDAVTARAEADALRALCAAEGVTLDAETEATLRAVTRRAAEPVRTHDDNGAIEPDLVGRERELAALISQLTAAERGAAQSAFVAGPPGIGKTRLLDDFVRVAAARRHRVVRCAGARSTERFPYAAVARAADGLAALPGARGVSPETAAILAAVSPALADTYATRPAVRPDGDVARLRLLAMADLVRAVCTERPTVIVVDDTQWLDEASRDVLVSLADVCAGSALLVVFAARDGGGSLPVGGPRGVPIVLEPLDASACSGLVASVARLPDADWAREWMRTLRVASAGVPLGIVDVLRLSVERGVVAVRDGEWSTSSPADLIALTEESAPRRARVAALHPSLRDIVTLLGVAGGPVPDLVAASALDVTPATLREACGQLAHRGLARLDGSMLRLDHEEYGAAAREAADVATRRAILGSLARAFSGPAGTPGGVASLRRAHALATEGGDTALAVDCARRYLAASHALAPARSSRDHLADLIGIGPDAERLDLLARELGEGGSSRAARRWLVAATLAAAAVAAAAAFLRPARRPDVSLVLVNPDGRGGVAVREAALHLDDWRAGEPIVMGRARRAPAVLSSTIGIRRSPVDPAAWLAQVPGAGSAADEVALVEASAPARLLAPGVGDDVAPAWSPDGRRVAFVSSRWTGDRGDIAVVDVTMGSLTRLGGGPGELNNPVFAADGAGIVYYRVDRRRAAFAACVVRLPADTAERPVPRCRELPAASPAADPAWPADQTVLVAAADRAVSMTKVLEWDLASDSLRLVATCGGTMPRGQALTAVIVCDPGGDVRRRVVAPTAHPEAWRPVRWDAADTVAGAILLVVDQMPGRAQLTGVRIQGARDAVAGVPHSLRAEGVRANGSVSADPPVAWWVRGEATVSREGVLMARAPGQVVVGARLDAARADSVVVDVRPRTDAIVLREAWDRDWLLRWRPFGDPVPFIARSGNEWRLVTGGDGRYFSGAYSRETFVTASGLALDAELATPPSSDYRMLHVGIVTGLHGDALVRWDHRTGYPPNLPNLGDCFFEHRTGGPENRTSFSSATWSGPVADSSNGRPY
ncbi:MAG: AAA family ATPase, partial [Gemmatimonadota bacterium]|nr:AAA family ATPase [Gemmatimonadota bacterium]